MNDLLRRLRAIVGPDGVIDAVEEIAGYRGDLACPVGGPVCCVVRPRKVAEVSDVVRVCGAFGMSITPRGGGTGLVGGATPALGQESVVLSFERMRAIRTLDPIDDVVVVEAGCVLADVQSAAAKAGRLLGLDHGGAGSSQIGGNLSTNSGGNNVLRYGTARDQVLGLEVVLADGTILSNLRSLRKNNVGTDIKQLFLGSEGTLGLITAASMRLRPLPALRTTLCVGAPSPEAALAVFALARAIFAESISAFELLPRSALDHYFRYAGARHEPFDPSMPWTILMEADSQTPHFALDAAANEFINAAMRGGLIAAGTIASSETQRMMLWRLREGVAEAMIATTGCLKSDTAVPISTIPVFIGQATQALARIAPAAVPVPFGHIGDGNIHFNALPPPDGPADQFIACHAEVAEAIEDIAIALGGTVSAEHGIGLLKRDGLRRMRTRHELALMGAIKALLDPANILNPGKIFTDDFKTQ